MKERTSKLQEYKRKRDFSATPEPAGAVSGHEPDAPRFVIQQHDATRLHWDLRLERDGVLVSFALPKGLPRTPDDDHLAVHTEDHPMEYLTFEGDIPDGQYGAGRMFVWDTGTYEARTFTDNKVVMTLHGQRAHGQFALFPFKGRDWLIHRMDPPDDPAASPPPADLRPMWAVAGRSPRAERAWEICWRGLRVLVAAEPGEVTMRDATGEDVGAAFPDVRRIGRATGAVSVLLDGVIVEGREGAIEARRAAARPDTARRWAHRYPVRLALFDALWHEGHSVLERPWQERRELLESLRLDGDAWFTPSVHVGDGAAIKEAADAGGVEALIAKRPGSPYRPGVASKDWTEVTL